MGDEKPSVMVLSIRHIFAPFKPPDALFTQHRHTHTPTHPCRLASLSPLGRAGRENGNLKWNLFARKIKVIIIHESPAFPPTRPVPPICGDGGGTHRLQDTTTAAAAAQTHCAGRNPLDGKRF